MVQHPLARSPLRAMQVEDALAISCPRSSVISHSTCQQNCPVAPPCPQLAGAPPTRDGRNCPSQGAPGTWYRSPVCAGEPTGIFVLAQKPKTKNNKASSLTSLFRNQRGSVGIAFVTTFLAQRRQYHQSGLVAHATPSSSTIGKH